MGRIIKRIQRSAYEGGWMKEGKRLKRHGFHIPNHRAVKEARRLAAEHREETRVQSRGRRFMGAITRLFRRQER